MQTAVTIGTIFYALVFVVAGMARLQRLPAAETLRTRLGVSETMWRSAGGLELLGSAAVVVGVFAIPSLAVSAAVGLAVLCVAAIVVHGRAGDLWPGAAPAAFMAAMSLVDAALVQAFVV